MAQHRGGSPRTPATKLAHLQKKIRKQQQAKRSTDRAKQTGRPYEGQASG